MGTSSSIEIVRCAGKCNVCGRQQGCTFSTYHKRCTADPLAGVAWPRSRHHLSPRWSASLARKLFPSAFMVTAADLVGSIMEPYIYRPLSSAHHSIRLLRLLPAQDENATIECELFEYFLGTSHDTHLYEALSYVWGDPNDTLPISLSGCRMDVTVNLHAALLCLRNHSLERILWVDAICINQDDQQEKASQIQFMVVIYDQATRVVAWLGEAADDSHLAFEEIRAAGRKKSMIVSDHDGVHAAGLALLHRPWFRRIWVCLWSLH
jgi:hypothetical protein